MKFKLTKFISNFSKFLVLFISLNNIKPTLLLAEDPYFDEMDSSTKIEGNSSDLPSNPFELVEMIRRANSMNDATKPSDAIDDALKSFNKIEEK